MVESFVKKVWNQKSLIIITTLQRKLIMLHPKNIFVGALFAGLLTFSGTLNAGEPYASNSEDDEPALENYSIDSEGDEPAQENYLTKKINISALADSFGFQEKEDTQFITQALCRIQFSCLETITSKLVPLVQNFEAAKHNAVFTASIIMQLSPLERLEISSAIKNLKQTTSNIKNAQNVNDALFSFLNPKS